MKKLLYACTTLMIILLGSYSVTEDAASKADTKKTVYKAVTSVKSGSYTYYSDGKAIYRESAKGKKTKLSTYPADGDFIIKGNYIYYHSQTKNKIYRMTKSGKKQKQYKVSASQIRAVKGGYIYYNNALGLNRINLAESNKTHLLGYSSNMDSIIIGNRIYYEKYVRQEDANGTEVATSYIYSVNLKGKNKKTHVKFDNTTNVSIAGNDRYLFSIAELETGFEVGLIDTKDETLTYNKLYLFPAEENAQDGDYYRAITVIGKKLYLQNKEALYSVSVTGKVAELMKISADLEDQGVTLMEKQGDYYWVQFDGDDDFNYNYIFDKEWNQVKKITRKYGNVTGFKIKGKKAYVIFNKSEDNSTDETFMTYKIYTIK